jgi:hydrogenase nickel incorporation protein HypB
MCGVCGCGEPGPARAGAPGHAHPDAPDAHRHEHGHAHDHAEEARRVEVGRSLLAENDARAARLRARLAARGIEAIGLLGGPGAGKTALLEATFARLGAATRNEAVIEGDCATDLDARRIAACGARVAQVATGSLCHLDAHLVEHALETLDLRGVARLFVENVGNLVCPAPFSCGESRRALLVSVPEGDDKPAKYPAAVAAADLLVVTKSDLLPHVPFELARCLANARAVKPELPALVLSARTGEGMDAWLAWLRSGGA